VKCPVMSGLNKEMGCAGKYERDSPISYFFEILPAVLEFLDGRTGRQTSTQEIEAAGSSRTSVNICCCHQNVGRTSRRHRTC
jgi:hypothetical protein